MGATEEGDLTQVPALSLESSDINGVAGPGDSEVLREPLAKSSKLLHLSGQVGVFFPKILQV